MPKRCELSRTKLRFQGSLPSHFDKLVVDFHLFKSGARLILFGSSIFIFVRIRQIRIEIWIRSRVDLLIVQRVAWGGTMRHGNESRWGEGGGEFWVIAIFFVA